MTHFFSDLWLKITHLFGRQKKADTQVSLDSPEMPTPSSAESGILQAPDANSVSDVHVQMMDAQTKKAAEKKERIKNAKLPLALRRLRFSDKQRLTFYDELATLVGSGVTLIDSLSLIQAQEKNKTVKKLYAQMIHEINAGLSLAEAMEFFPHIFPFMQSALIEASEASGNLKDVLAELVVEMEAAQGFKKKVTGAMVYPIILIGMSLVLVVAMMTFVIPKIADMYSQSNVELPALTQLVIDISDFVVTHWLVLLLSVLGSIILLSILIMKARVGRLAWEKLVSIVPVVGLIAREKNIMMVASNMAMLMKGGVLITEAFAITKKTIGNLHYQKALDEIRQGVVMGKEVSQMMGLEDIRLQKFNEHKLFPLQVAQLIHIGETTGNIAVMLDKIKKNYHKSIDHKLQNISTLIEPLMIFIVAALVGSILMAVMLPFFYIGSTIG